MSTLRVRDFATDRILVSRESALPLVAAIQHQIAVADRDGRADSAVVVDFTGVEGIAPSFMDELLSAFGSPDDADTGFAGTVIVANPPT